MTDQQRKAIEILNGIKNEQKLMTVFDNLKCKLGFHKPAQWYQTYKYKCRTTNKGRSKKRWTTWAKEIVTVTYCERCGKTLRTKSRRRWR